MIVIADTSPLNYLIQIDCEHLLPRLYGRIVIPSGVINELQHESAPPSVRAWLARIPQWIDIEPASAKPDESLADLDLGERQAIQLAEERNADLLLIDERKGRQRARQRGLRTTDTLGVLLSAERLGLIDAETAYRRLQAETTFRTSLALESQFLQLIRRTP